jgi:hypothetical protein
MCRISRQKSQYEQSWKNGRSTRRRTVTTVYSWKIQSMTEGLQWLDCNMTWICHTGHSSTSFRTLKSSTKCAHTECFEHCDICWQSHGYGVLGSHNHFANRHDTNKGQQSVTYCTILKYLHMTIKWKCSDFSESVQQCKVALLSWQTNNFCSVSGGRYWSISHTALIWHLLITIFLWCRKNTFEDIGFNVMITWKQQWKMAKQ